MKNDKVPTVEVKLGSGGFCLRYSYNEIAEAAEGVNEALEAKRRQMAQELEAKRRQMAQELLQTNPWVVEHQRRNPPRHTIGTGGSPGYDHARVQAASEVSPGEADAAVKPETKTIHCVRCQRCHATTTYSNFLYHGTRIKECKCKPGRERWVSVDVEVEITDRKVVKAP